MPEVSVLIPLFGTHRGRDVLADVCAAWLAQSIATEVIVAIAGTGPPSLPADTRVRVIRANSAVASPGTLRNLAARHAAGRRLYLSDADVRPLGTDFLERAHELAGGRPLVQPWMYRLVGLADVGGDDWWRELAGQRCCFLRADPAAGRITSYPAERYVTESGELFVLPPDELAVTSGPAEQRWRSPFHWGGLLLERALFTAVGGYCPDYAGWGCEDDDLLAKVTLMTSVSVAWRAAPTLRCLHFEHQRPYSTPAFAANQSILARRLAAGPAAMIATDLQTYERLTDG